MCISVEGELGNDEEFTVCFKERLFICEDAQVEEFVYAVVEGSAVSS